MLNQKRVVDIQKIETFYQKYTHLHGTTNGWPSLDIAEDVYLVVECGNQAGVQLIMGREGKRMKLKCQDQSQLLLL